MWDADSHAAQVEGYAAISATALLTEDPERGFDAERSSGIDLVPRRLRRAAGMVAASGMVAVLLLLSVSIGGEPFVQPLAEGAAEHAGEGLWAVPWFDAGAVQDGACSTVQRLFGYSMCITTSTTTTTTTVTTTTTNTVTTSTKTTTTSTTRTTSTSTTKTSTSTTSITTTTTMFPLWSRPVGSGKKVIVKGISYAPAPLKQPGAMLPNDDFMSETSATLWGPPGHGPGRRDLMVMKSLGANAVRLYGNDPALDHSAFINESKGIGLDVIVGLSDYPFVQMPGSCMETGFDCFHQIKEQYGQNLQKGFLSNTTSYHEGLRTVILMNEPDLKFEGGLRGTPGPPEHWGKALVSAFDGVISAEQELGITGPAPNFTVAFSFGRCDLCSKLGRLPGIAQMLELRRYMKDPSLLNYAAHNDLWSAYQTRFINSFNTANPAIDIRPLFLDAYDNEFPHTPVFIGEYHSPNFANQRSDLTKIMEIASNESTMLTGLSFFEFQKRYDKGGGEMAFGMFGLNDQPIAPTTIATREYNAWCLTPVELEPQREEAKASDPSRCGVQRVDVDFVVEGGWGQHYDHIPTPDECCSRCHQEHRCEIWTWVKDAGLDGVPSQCWLKGGAPGKETRKPGVVSSNMKAKTVPVKKEKKPAVDHVHTVLNEAFGGHGLAENQLCPVKGAASKSSEGKDSAKPAGARTHADSRRIQTSPKAGAPKASAPKDGESVPLGWSQVGQLRG